MYNVGTNTQARMLRLVNHELTYSKSLTDQQLCQLRWRPVQRSLHYVQFIVPIVMLSIIDKYNTQIIDIMVTDT